MVVLRGIIVAHALNGVGGVGDFRVRRNQSPFFECVPHVCDCSVFVGDTRNVASNHLVRLRWNYRMFPLEVVAEKSEETALANREGSLFALCKNPEKGITSEHKSSSYGYRETN